MEWGVSRAQELKKETAGQRAPTRSCMLSVNALRIEGEFSVVSECFEPCDVKVAVVS